MFPFGTLLAAKPPESVFLNGSLGSPVTHDVNGFSESSETYHQRFNICSVDSIPNSLTRGKLERAGYKEGVLAVYTEVHSWVVPNDYQDGPYWARLTFETGTGVTPDVGTMDTWSPLTSNFIFGWSHNGGVARGGTVKAEIATDDAGAEIVATGWYRGTVTVTP